MGAALPAAAATRESTVVLEAVGGRAVLETPTAAVETPTMKVETPTMKVVKLAEGDMHVVMVAVMEAGVVAAAMGWHSAAMSAAAAAATGPQRVRRRQ
jgi:hypothetical protein